MKTAMARIVHSGMMALLLAAACGAAVHAQDFPNRPLRVIVPLPPGGPTDWLSRAVGEQLTKRMGQPVITENKPGAGGYTGSEVAARAEPDGYTLLLASNGVVTYPMFIKDSKIDPIHDFAPLSIVMETPWIIVTNAAVPARTLAEYIAYARANPGKLNFAMIPNSTQQLDIVRFMKGAGLEVTLVNYNGTAAVYPALLANDVQGYFGAWSAISPHAKTGRLVPLAAAAAHRLSWAPDLPTAREAGVDFEADTWFAYFAPAGTAPARVARLAGEIAAAVKGELSGRIREIGYEPVGSTPEEMARAMSRDQATYSAMAAAIGVKPQ